VFDSYVFSDEAVAADTREYNRLVAEATADAKWPPASVTEYREALPDILAGLSGGVLYVSERARDEVVTFGGLGVPVRIIESPDPVGIYLNIHGGGWTIAEPGLFDKPLEDLAIQTGMTVVSPNYRKAPEHPYPAGLDDCEAVARWLIDGGGEALGSARLAIGGDSSGANLALATILRLKDADLQDRIDAVNLLYGVFDAALTPSVTGRDSDHGPVTAAMMQWYVDQYVSDPVQLRNPEVSPLRADLRGLPRTLLTVGTKDVLVDDSMFLYGRMVASEVDVTLDLYPGGVHGFDLAPIEIAAEAKQRMAGWLAKAGQ
jgi:acetyl esterase